MSAAPASVASVIGLLIRQSCSSSAQAAANECGREQFGKIDLARGGEVYYNTPNLCRVLDELSAHRSHRKRCSPIRAAAPWE